MFIGHYAMGMAAKKMDPKLSLGTTFLASQLLDLLWPLFLLWGFEKVEIEPGNTLFTPLNFVSYPFSHSLVAALVWALVLGAIYYSVKKNQKGAVLLALLVISHWVLDYVTHRPDLPLSFSQETKVGLGLWNNKIMTILIEVFLLAAGCYLYITATQTKNRIGNLALWGFILFIVIIYFFNVFGPPPPSTEAIPYAGFAQWLFIIWGYWIDHNRSTVTPSLSTSHKV